MKYAFLSTWQMSYDGIKIAKEMLEKEALPLSDALCAAVRAVEDNPEYHSVGYGAYPNWDGDVQTDAAYMDGTTFRFGGVAGARDLRNPVDVAHRLSANAVNCYLCGDGAEAYARRSGHAMRNLLTDEAKAYWWENRNASALANGLEPYDGHDTVCVIGLMEKHMAIAASTSGLYMKRPGRIGDTSVIGSGFYCDSQIGGAAATGVGEDIMRGCLSYEIVRRMASGMDPQTACYSALSDHAQRMAQAGNTLGAVSFIALSADGRVGASTTLPEFAFVFADQHHPATVWIAENTPNGLQVGPADETRLREYRNG